MRIAIYGVVLTMIAQPGGGVDNCRSGCIQRLVDRPHPAQRLVARPAVAVPSPVAQTHQAATRVPVHPKRVTPGNGIFHAEVLAIDGEAAVAVDFPPVQQQSLLMAAPIAIPADAVKPKLSASFDRLPAGITKSAEQRAQDAWDARQKLAYVDPIVPNAFGYAEVRETASGGLLVISAMAEQANITPQAVRVPDSAAAQEIQNNKSQASSAPMADQDMELLPK